MTEKPRPKSKTKDKSKRSLYADNMRFQLVPEPQREPHEVSDEVALALMHLTPK